MIGYFVNVGYWYIRVRTLELVVVNLTALQVRLIDMPPEEGICIGLCGMPLLLPVLLADHHASWEDMRGGTYDRGGGIFRLTTRCLEANRAVNHTAQRNPLLTFHLLCLSRAL